MNSYMIGIAMLLQLLLLNLAVVGLREEEVDKEGLMMQSFHAWAYREE